MNERSMTDSPRHTSDSEWSAWDECKSHWRVYLIGWVVSFSLAIIVCAGIPKTYSSQVKIADEHYETDLLLGLNNIAAWAKTGISDHKGLRMPEVYYRLVTSPSFAEEMSRVNVSCYHTDYYHYILNHHQLSWWERMGRGLSKDTLSEKERVLAVIHGNIRSKVSSKYGTTTMQVTDQDPLVAAMLVDSVRAHLQRHLADYSRRRAVRDLVTSANKMERARQDYEKARDAYASYRDTHNDLTSVRASSVENHLLSEYEKAFNTYTKEQEQYIRAKALVDKFSFKFVVLKNATVPLDPSGPQVIGYVSSFLFLATVFISWLILGLRTYKDYHLKG